MIGNSVFHPVSHKLGVGELAAVDCRVDAESGVWGEELFPVEVAHAVVKLVGVGGRELYDGLKDSQGGAATEVGLVHDLVVSLERDHAESYFYIFGPQGDELVAEHILKPLECLGHHLECIVHVSVWL